MANWNVIRTEQGSIPTDCGDMLFVKVYVSDILTPGAQFSNIDLPSSVFSGFTVSFYGSSNLLTRFNAKRVKTELSGSRFYIRYYDDTGILKATEDESVAYIQDNYAALLWAMLIDPSGNAILIPNYMFRSSSSIQKLTDNTATQLGTMRVNRSWYISGTMVISQTDLDKGKAILLSGLPNDPYGTLPENQNPGSGYGPYDYSSEIETPPQLPTLSAAQVGFVSLWNPTQSEMQGLANYLWTGTFDLTNFKKLFTDPMDCVLSVGIIPITPTREASKREIVFGGSSHSGISAYAVTDQFYIVDMGTLHITGMSQGALDYSPYAKASIYLPYCGTYALDVDEIMDSDISLEYHIDIYTGACVAYLTIDGHLNSDGKNVNAIMYQFTGNVLASIPITGNDHSQFIQSMLFMGAAAAATVATSGAGAGAAASSGADLGAETAATGFNKALAGSAVNTVMSMKPNVLHSGNLSTTAGMLGGQKPFITMTWSNLCRPEDEYKLIGLPLHKSGTLSDFSGFTIVSACHMDNILCTDTELQMIEQALAKGVII